MEKCIDVAMGLQQAELTASLPLSCLKLYKRSGAPLCHSHSTVVENSAPLSLEITPIQSCYDPRADSARLGRDVPDLMNQGLRVLSTAPLVSLQCLVGMNAAG